TLLLWGAPTSGRNSGYGVWSRRRGLRHCFDTCREPWRGMTMTTSTIGRMVTVRIGGKDDTYPRRWSGELLLPAALAAGRRVAREGERGQLRDRLGERHARQLLSHTDSLLSRFQVIF